MFSFSVPPPSPLFFARMFLFRPLTFSFFPFPVNFSRCSPPSPTTFKPGFSFSLNLLCALPCKFFPSALPCCLFSSPAADQPPSPPWASLMFLRFRFLKFSRFPVPFLLFSLPVMTEGMPPTWFEIVGWRAPLPPLSWDLFFAVFVEIISGWALWWKAIYCSFLVD